MKKEKECSSCKKQGLNGKEVFMIALGFFVTASAIYGIIHFIKNNF